MGRIEKNYIDQLYKLLEKAVQAGDTSGAAALRWAIHNLEYTFR